jgi:uncharacterized protein (UPF0335 family)
MNPKRRKTRKSEEKEARLEQAAKEVSQSVRDVYRKLASALHPDRETDPVTQKQRTEQMQRVNQAYEAGDLLTLLNIQLEVEQIDADHLTSLSAERLAHYNMILKDQLNELKGEVNALIAPFMSLVPYRSNLTPDKVDSALSDEIARIGADIKQIRQDIEDLQDPANLSIALKQMQKQQTDAYEDEFAELEFLMSLMETDTPQPKRRTRKR